MENQSNFPLGRIRPGTLAATSDTVAAQATDLSEARGHRGEAELGIRKNAVAEVEVSPEQYLSPELPLPVVTDSGRPPRPWAWLLNPTVLLAIAGLLAAGTLFMGAQVASLVRDLSTLPEWLRYPSYGLLLMFLGIIAVSVIRLVVCWFRLAASPGFSLQRMQELTERRHLRTLVKVQKANAKKQLISYLQAIPIASQDARRALREVGFTDDELERLRRGQTDLLDDSIPIAPETWLKRFQERIVSIQDDVGFRCILRHAIAVGGKTAVSPNAVIDMLAVLYSTSTMIRELCLIYNLRTTNLGTLGLLVESFLNVFAAGKVEGITDTVFQEISANYTEGVARPLLAMVSAKTSEGIANGVLLYRLGLSARAQLQPISGP